MRHPIEICLATWEWTEDKRAKASAWKLLKKTEKKSFATFLSQGAVGGAFAFFLLAVFGVALYRNYYNFSVLLFLPFVLVFGSVYGFLTVLFVGIPASVFQRRFRFGARTALAIAGASLLTIAWHYLVAATDSELVSVWELGFICAVGLTVALVTGSRVKPFRVLVFGAGRHDDRHNFSSWLSIPFGFVLRAASVFGLLEALMGAAVWISDQRGDGPPSAPPEHLPAIALVVLYFAISSYLSIKTPRKSLLLPTAILLNLPPAVWIGQRGSIEISGALDLSVLLVYLGEGFICLWGLYTLGRMISSESASGVKNSGVTVVRLDYGKQRTKQMQSVAL